jgi:hypothetical protein
MPAEEMVCLAVHTNPDKLRQVGKAYDVAHAKLGAMEANVGEMCRVDELFTPIELKAARDLSGSRVQDTESGTESETDSKSEGDSDSGSTSQGSSSTRPNSAERWTPGCIIGLRALAHAGTGIVISVSL